MSMRDVPEVTTTAGAVRGRREEGLAVFRGIPYARPPVGAARFGAPRPVDRWDGVRDALAFGPPPPQEPVGPETAPAGSTPSGDDWLTVNVWTPDPDPAARRPVMVWIYGGAYKLGSADDPAYDASRLARENEVVMVTFNYRVGVEGFLRIEGAPANRGLLDQVAALEWVRENITAFGGDPEQVTVFGESAGAGSVSALLAMPRARSLFRRAIAQSVPGPLFSEALAQDIAEVLAGGIGLRPTTADLSEVDPRKLTEAGAALGSRMRAYAHRWGPVALTPTAFAPVVDGDVLATTPWEALATGAARDMELVIGHTRDEYRFFLHLDGTLGRRVDEEHAALVLGLFGPAPDAGRAYRAAFPDASAERLCELVRSDWLFRMPSLHLAEAHTSGGGRAYLYELTYPAPADGALGSCHGLDVPLVFGVSGGIAEVLIGPAPSPRTEALSARFRSAWTSFAATGDPGWPAYDTDRRLVQVFDTVPVVTPYPEEASRRLWERHVFAPLPLVGP